MARQSGPEVRYRRWRKAVAVREQNPDSPDWKALDREEQDAWDDMADHDDPEYVRLVEETL